MLSEPSQPISSKIEQPIPSVSLPDSANALAEHNHEWKIGDRSLLWRRSLPAESEFLISQPEPIAQEPVPITQEKSEPVPEPVPIAQNSEIFLPEPEIKTRSQLAKKFMATPQAIGQWDSRKLARAGWELVPDPRPTNTIGCPKFSSCQQLTSNS